MHRRIPNGHIERQAPAVSDRVTEQEVPKSLQLTKVKTKMSLPASETTCRSVMTRSLKRQMRPILGERDFGCGVGLLLASSR